MVFPGWQAITDVCDKISVGTGKADIPDCHFDDVIKLFRNGTTDLILISTLIVVVAMVVAGMKLVTSGGNPSALTEVKTMFRKIVTGYAVILVAWVVVYTITSTLLKPGFSLLIGSQ